MFKSNVGLRFFTLVKKANPTYNITIEEVISCTFLKTIELTGFKNLSGINYNEVGIKCFYYPNEKKIDPQAEIERLYTELGQHIAYYLQSQFRFSAETAEDMVQQTFFRCHAPYWKCF